MQYASIKVRDYSKNTACSKHASTVSISVEKELQQYIQARFSDSHHGISIARTFSKLSVPSLIISIVNVLKFQTLYSKQSISSEKKLLMNETALFF